MTDHKAKPLSRAEVEAWNDADGYDFMVMKPEILATLDAQDELLARLAVAHEALAARDTCGGWNAHEFPLVDSRGRLKCSRCGQDAEADQRAEEAIAATPEALTTWLAERDAKVRAAQALHTNTSVVEAMPEALEAAFARGVEAAIAKVESFNLERIEDRAVLLMITAALRTLLPKTEEPTK